MWYYQESYKQVGPIDSAEMEKLIRNGQISRSTKVWREGMADWQPANQTELIEILKTPIENKKVTEALSLSVCIIALAIFGALLLHGVGDWINDRWIRALGYVLMMDIFPLALFVLNIILLKQMKNAGIALIQKQ